MGIWIPLYLLIMILKPAWPQTPTQAEQQAQQQGQTQAEGVLNQVTQSAADQLELNATPNRSFLNSSLNNHYNSIVGQTTAVTVAGELRNAADQTAINCQAPASEDPDCVAAGVLFEMGTEALNYSTRFNELIGTAWNNICEWRSTGCDENLVNPLANQLQEAQQQVQNSGNTATQTLENVGYTVNPTTGQVIKPDGTEIQIGDEKTLKKQLGDERGSELFRQVIRIQEAAEKKVRKFSFERYLKVIGIDLKKVNQQSSVSNSLTNMSSGSKGSDMADSDESGLYNHRKFDVFNKGRPSTEELFKLLDGSPIGVSGDNIFKMIQRQYQRQIKSNSFLK